MNYQYKTKAELIKELQKLQRECDSLKKSYTQDIAECGCIEKPLMESENQYRLLFENSGEAMLLTKPDGSIYSANPEACRIFGRSAEEICEIGRTGIIDFNDVRLEPALNERKKTGKFRGELNLLRKDGTKFPAEVTSTIFIDTSGNERISMIIRDISERKQMEEILREGEEQYKSIVQIMPDGVAIHTDGKVVFANEAAGKIMKAKNIDQMIGISPIEYVHPDYREIGLQRIKKSLSEQIPAESLEETFIALDGKPVQVIVTSIPFLYMGKPSMLTVFTDITERKQAEEEIRKSAKLMEDLHMHLNVIREEEHAMTSREIHDQIGQSLTALKIDLNWMHKYIKTDPEAVAKIQGMIELVTNTIKAVQRISSELRPGILDDLGLDAAIEWYCEEFEKRTAVKCSLKLDDSTVGDSQKNLVFFRVLQEALTNVIRHANASSVTIKLHHTQKGTTLTIHDNGIGIPKEKINSYKSLGLIGIRERVRLLNGKVDISSKKGDGTKLTIFMPS